MEDERWGVVVPLTLQRGYTGTRVIDLDMDDFKRCFQFRKPGDQFPQLRARETESVMAIGNKAHR